PVNGAEERFHHDPEPQPVVRGVGFVADDLSEVLDDVFLLVGGEAIPDPRPGKVEDEGEGGRFHLGLGHLLRPPPTLRARGVGACHEAAGVEFRVPVRIFALRAGELEPGEEEGAGEAFQRVGSCAVAARGSRQEDIRVARGGERAHGEQHLVGELRQLGAGANGHYALTFPFSAESASGRTPVAPWWRIASIANTARRLVSPPSEPAMCGVTVTLGSFRSGWPTGSGSGSVTSRIASIR